MRKHWKSHGGFSAFFNLDRKFSRVETASKIHDYDVFMACRELPLTLDGLKDLVGYSLLIIAEVAELYEESPDQFILRMPIKRNLPDYDLSGTGIRGKMPND